MARSYKKKTRMHQVIIQVWVCKDFEAGKVTIMPDGYSIHRSFNEAYSFRAHLILNSSPTLYFSGAPYCAMVGDKKYDELIKFGNLYFSKKPPSRRKCRRPRI